jgi:uncharacterized protein YbjQ (UPF0145 family)
MAVCDTCGRNLGMFVGSKGRCEQCRHRNLNPENYARITEHEKFLADKARRFEAEEKASALKIDKQRNAIILTTETAPAGLLITKRLGIVTSECGFGMHMFKDIFAIGRDLVGGRSSTIQNTLKDARNIALQELKAEAFALGANAVIAIDLDYSEISGGGKSMLFLVASGTAVFLQDTST